MIVLLPKPVSNRIQKEQSAGLNNNCLAAAMLLTCRCFLEQCGMQKPGYKQWVEEQKEIGHLLSHLTLD
jgi:hypothetical protein